LCGGGEGAKVRVFKHEAKIWGEAEKGRENKGGSGRKFGGTGKKN